MIQKGLETERERIAPKCSIRSNVNRLRVGLRSPEQAYATRPSASRSNSLASSDRRNLKKTKRTTLMKTKLGMVIAGLAMIIVAAMLSPVASAGCGKVDKPGTGASLWQEPSRQTDSEDGDPIVGFWRVNLVSKDNPGIPDGTVLDAGYSQWHSDGTEILNSSRAPETQSFCLGVWKKIRPFQYRLNHFTISWANGNLLGPGNIRENVILSRDGNSFTGTFTIDQYDQAGNILVHLVGQIEGKRITVDTSVTDVL